MFPYATFECPYFEMHTNSLNTHYISIFFIFLFQHLRTFSDKIILL